MDGPLVLLVLYLQGFGPYLHEAVSFATACRVARRAAAYLLRSERAWTHGWTRYITSVGEQRIRTPWRGSRAEAEDAWYVFHLALPEALMYLPALPKQGWNPVVPRPTCVAHGARIPK
jgi:hypothetical protein